MGFNAPKHMTFGYHICKSYVGSKFFLDRGSEIISTTKVHIDFGDVQRLVMMVVLGAF